MAFDAKYLSCVLNEIREKCLGARVEKIHQPSRDCIILLLRCAQGREKLWLDQKNVAVAHTCSPEEAEILFSPQLAQKLEKDFKKLQPVYDFFRKVQTLSFEQTQQEDTPLPKAPRQQFDW